MAQISSYPIVSPKLVDTFVVSQGYDPNAGDPIIGNPTGLVSIEELVDLINSGLIPGTGTVTSVSGAGTVSGLTLTGTVTSTGSLTLGGALTLTSSQITEGLGFAPYNDTNPNGFTSFAEPGIFSGGGTPTLASGVTGAEIRTLIGVDNDDYVRNTLDTYTGTDKVKQIITLSQVEYDAITTPLSDTLYIIL